MQDMDLVYREHAKTVYRFLLSRTRNEDVAEELTQETFYKAVKNADRFDGSCQISTWLCAIATNCLNEYYRKHPATEELGEDAAVGVSTEAQVLAGAGQVSILRQIRSLGGETAEIMTLRLLGDLSFREIGEILDITENKARVTFFRGKEKLKKELMNDEK